MTDSSSKNYFYTLVRVGTSLLFPLITFPYVSRVLGAEKLGVVSYTHSLIQYIILFTELGLSVYGVREIGKVYDNPRKLKSTFTELLIIKVINTGLVLITFSIILRIFPSLIPESGTLVWISFGYILLNVGVLDWLFQGIHRVKIIATRTIVARVAILICLFLFVKSESDYWVYYVLLSLDTVASLFFGIYFSRSLISFRQRLTFLHHYKPLLALFSVQIMVGFYIHMDKFMLGLMASMEDVGNYTISLKIVKVVQSIITSIGLVMIPILTKIIDEGNSIYSATKKTLDFIIFLSIPLTGGLLIIKNELIMLFAGNEYTGAIELLAILAPIVIFVGLSNLYATQLLVAGGFERSYFLIAFLGASINLTMNIILIPSLRASGAAYSTLLAEGVVALVSMIICRFHYKDLPLPRIIMVLRYSFLTLLFYPIYVSMKGLDLNSSLTFILFFICCLLLYAGTLWLVFRDQQVIMIKNKLSQLLKSDLR